MIGEKGGYEYNPYVFMPNSFILAKSYSIQEKLPFMSGIKIQYSITLSPHHSNCGAKRTKSRKPIKIFY